MNEPQSPRPADQIARALAASLALILLVVGQMVLLTLPDGTAAGLLTSLLGIIIFIIFAVRPSPTRLSRATERVHLSYRAILTGIAIGLAIIAAGLSVVFEIRDRTDYTPVLVIWAGSLLALVATFAEGRSFPVRAWLKDHRNELLLLATITLGVAALRFIALGQLPRVINGDEGLIGQFILAGKGNPLANPWSLFENIGGLYRHLIGLAMKLFDQTPFALRLLPAIGGTLAIPALYLLARQLFGKRAALFAALILAVSHAHIHFSRTVAVSYIQGTWLAPLELYFFISGLEKRDSLRMALAGILLAIHFNVYVSAQIIIALLAVYLIIVAIANRPLVRGAGRTITTFWASLLLTALPQIVYNTRHPDEFLARLNNGGIFQSTWLADEAARTGSSQLQVLVGRVAHAFLSLNQYPAQDFYGSNLPLLTPIAATLFILGLAYALWRTRDHRHLLLNGWFWSITIAVGIFSLPPSADSYRMLVALPAAIVMAAIALDQLLNLLALPARQPRAVQAGLALFIFAAIAFTNVRAYFVDFIPNCRYGGDTPTRFASYLGNYLRTLDRETTVYLLSNETLRYGTHMSVDFLSKSLPVKNVDSPVSEIQPDINTAIVAIGPRADELRQWARDNPGGHLHQEYDCGNLMLLAYWRQ